MEANLTLTPFELRGTAVHIPPGGHTSVLRGDDLKSRLMALPPGLLLGTFQVACSEDVHPHLWEMHPAGDEILVMLTGALDVTHADGGRVGSSSLLPGHGLVMPRGVWHRLALREPGLLLTLTPLEGTLHGREPGVAS